jgi:hypothetical protein
MNSLPHFSDSMKPERSTSFAGAMLKLLALLFGVGLLLYLLVVAWLHHHLSGQAVSISQAAGIPADAERVLQGFLSWLLAIAMVQSLIRLALESLSPRRSSSAVILKLLTFMAIGIVSAILPHGLRTLRGVDAQGLPIHMGQSDPRLANWWDPDGHPVLFYSAEKDATLRFWNRPGTTPDTGLVCLPVTREQRSLWERKISELAAEGELEKQQAAKQETLRQVELKALAAQVQLAADEKSKAARESQDRAHALEMTALRTKQGDQASHLNSEREALRHELNEVKSALKSATDRTLKAEPISVENLDITRRNPPEWHAERILPERYLYIHDFPSRSVDIHLPYECEIEVEGEAPRVFQPGSAVVSLGSAGNFRVRSRFAQEFDIFIRPFTQ